jgi:hypothetical protein
VELTPEQIAAIPTTLKTRRCHTPTACQLCGNMILRAQRCYGGGTGASYKWRAHIGCVEDVLARGRARA